MNKILFCFQFFQGIGEEVTTDISIEVVGDSTGDPAIEGERVGLLNSHTLNYIWWHKDAFPFSIISQHWNDRLLKAFLVKEKDLFIVYNYRKISTIRRTLVDYKIVDHSDVVGASPVGAAPTTS